MSTSPAGERLFRNLLRTEEQRLNVVSHSHFGLMWAPETLSEFTMLAQHLGWERSGGWRGQANIDWRLDSGAVRRLAEPRPEDDLLGMPATFLEHQLREYENRLLDRSRMLGHGRRNGRDLSDLELLAVLQHHGAATRLLDFTRSVFIALWFACQGDPDEYGVVFGVDLEDSFVVRDASTLNRGFERLLDEAGARISTFRPSALSPRMPAQHAFLLWAPAEYRAWGSVGVGFADHQDDRPSYGISTFLSIAVPPALKANAGLHFETLFGFTDETMFPDLDGFSRAHGATAELRDMSPYVSLGAEAEEDPAADELPPADHDEVGEDCC